MLTVTLTHSYIRISIINIRDDLWLGLSQLCQEHNRLDFGAVFKSIIGSLHNWLKPIYGIFHTNGSCTPKYIFIWTLKVISNVKL